MSQAYAEAIEIIANQNADFRKIAVNLAKTFPEAFLALHHGVVEQGAEQGKLDRDIYDLYAAGNKVAAIKLHRTETGIGLKESKDYCDALFEHSGNSRNSGAPTSIKAIRELVMKSVSANMTYADEGSF